MQQNPEGSTKDNRANPAFYTFKNIVGNNKDLITAIDFGHRIACHNSSVLLIGETGTGKELFAHSIHNESTFAKGPFIALNCAAIPDTLMESVLFGTVEGAYTGAKNTEGLLLQANNGTIFLDEINSLNMESQAKLLRFLQDKTIRSVGDNKQRKISCRIISAVNKDSDMEAKSSGLRSDLYFRLSTVELHIPPLRKRKDDIPVLTNHFIRKFSAEFENTITQADNRLIELLMNYSWPGNIRELEHVIESAMNFVEVGETTLGLRHLSAHLHRKLAAAGTADQAGNQASPAQTDPYAARPNLYPSEKTLHEILDAVEREVIIERLIKNAGNISQTSKELGIFRQALQYRIKKYLINEREYE